MCISVYIYIHICVCIYVYMHICIYIYICIYVCMYLCIYIYVCMPPPSPPPMATGHTGSPPPSAQCIYKMPKISCMSYSQHVEYIRCQNPICQVASKHLHCILCARICAHMKPVSHSASGPRMRLSLPPSKCQAKAGFGH